MESESGLILKEAFRGGRGVLFLLECRGEASCGVITSSL